VFQHKNSHIRRTVVESIIEIRLWSSEQEYLSAFESLSPQQRKLVDICMKRNPLAMSKATTQGDVDED